MIFVRLSDVSSFRSRSPAALIKLREVTFRNERVERLSEIVNRSIYRDVPDRRQRVGIAVGVTDVNNTARTLAWIFDNSPTSGDRMPFEAECVVGFTRLLENDPFSVGQNL